jgi:glycosyltransferase involved in cell wall biosynthesis
MANAIADRERSVRTAMRISVVIPTYNRAGSVGEAIESALTQTRVPDEVVVVDDGSTDDTRSVLAAFGQRITVVTQSNAGVSAARNAGSTRASGDWLAFLDSDDVWHRNRIATLVRDADERAEGVHVADLVLEGPGYAESVLALRGLSFPSDTAARVERPLRQIMSGLSLNSIACRRDWLLRVGGFDTSLRMFEDLDLLVRLALEGPWLFTSAVVCRARRIVEEPGLALTAAACRNEILTREGLVRIFDRLALEERLDPDERGRVSRASSGALLALALSHRNAGSLANALPAVAKSVRAHPSPLKATVKAIAMLGLGRTRLAHLATRRRGFFREDAEA